MSEYGILPKTPFDRIMEKIIPGTFKPVSPPTSPLWPKKISDDAFHGIAGEIVNSILPDTEADPAALLINFLTSFGSVIGNRAHIRIGGDKHFMRLFSVLVGETSKGRKGTSWSYIKEIFCTIDPTWKARIQTGSSSGEGVTWAVRDPVEKTGTDKIGNNSQKTIIEEGVQDKRLLLVESEFVAILKMLTREGNTLSPIIRNAWDSGDLQILTKNSPVKATNTHISIIGHITKAELLKYFSNVETANGFGNRFLWFCVSRSKLLPYGGDLDLETMSAPIARLTESVNFAKNIDSIRLAEETRSSWENVYYRLSEGKPGIVASMTGRAEPYVLRIAGIYALLDCSDQILSVHLKAACAVWQYAEDSVKYIFQDMTGDSLADSILSMLIESPQGLSRTEISKRFQNHKSSYRLSEALKLLETLHQAQHVTNQTAGRPQEVWQLVKRSEKS